VILADLQRIVIPLPPIDEQRRIARILDAADELRVKRRRAVRNVDALPTSTFMRLFAGSGGWSRWPLRPLEDLVENQDSRRVPLKASDRTNRSGPFPYYGASGEIDRVDDYIFEGERLLVAEDGANLVTRTSPVAFIARGRFWVNNHAHVVAGTDRLDLHYLQRYLELTDLGPFITGTAQPKLNRSNLDRMLIPTPPMSQQQKFARMVEQVSNVADAHRAHLTRLEALFVSLEARAFAGEL
jgi:type I restriction enzyme S subunit